MSLAHGSPLLDRYEAFAQLLPRFYYAANSVHKQNIIIQAERFKNEAHSAALLPQPRCGQRRQVVKLRA